MAGPFPQLSHSFAQAAQLGLDYVDFFINEWGAGSDIYADGSGLVYPALGSVVFPAFAGIAIHPDSDIDRVTVQVVPKLVAGGGWQPNALSVTVKAPLIISAPMVPEPSAQSTNLVLRAYPDAVYHANYWPKAAAALAVFNDFVQPSIASKFVPPVLGLRLFRKGGALAGPQGRADQVWPMNRGNYGSNTMGGSAAAPLGAPTVLAGGGEHLLQILPIHGRKKLVGTFRTTDTAAVGVRFAVVEFTPTAPLTATTGGPTAERNLFGTFAVAANDTTIIPGFPNELQGDWLAIYYTLTAGAGSLHWFIRTSDQ